jgi:anti-sigma factor RsiW
MGLARRIREKLDHRWTERSVSPYLDGELSARQRRRLEAHAELCPDCGRLLRTLTLTLWELRELGRRAAHRSVAPGVVERLRDEAGTGPPRGAHS